MAVQSDRDGYLYLFDIDAEKKITQLFPNKYAPENKIQARQIRTIPSVQDKFQLRAGAPFGKSEVVAVVTTQPWEAPKQLQVPDGFHPVTNPRIASLRDQLRLLHEAAKSRGLDDTWASQRMVVEIAPAERAPASGPPANPVPPSQSETKPAIAKADLATPAPVPQPAPAKPELAAAAPPANPPSTETIAASIAVPAADAPPAVVAAAEESALPPFSLMDLDDASLSWEDQQNLQLRKPDLFRKLEALAERYSPVFWQDVSGGDFERHFQPWKDWFVRYDFDITDRGPNWPEPPRFQDEMKRERNHYLDSAFVSSSDFELAKGGQAEGFYHVRNKKTGETLRMDLRLFVYWAVLTTPMHLFFHYLASTPRIGKASSDTPGTWRAPPWWLTTIPSGWRRSSRSPTTMLK